MKRIGVSVIIAILLYYFKASLPFSTNILQGSVVTAKSSEQLLPDTTIWHMAIFNKEGALFIFEKTVPHKLTHQDSVQLMKETFDECLQVTISNAPVKAKP